MFVLNNLLPYFFLIYLTLGESPEALYHRAVKEWRSNRNWNAWLHFIDVILLEFDEEKKRLEVVGAIEEGILVIEKATVAMGEGVDIPRDSALSKMYCVYGKMLLELNSKECKDLALDPHTLLIGAETVSFDDESSTFLCKENAENALRNSLTLEATNVIAEKLLEEVTGQGNSVHKRKPKEFVAELFDSFADTFDEKLDSLEYRVPSIIGNMVKKLETKFSAVLDAGCGTGLVGRFVKPSLTNLLVGVDASQKMLDIAEKCTLKSGCGSESEKEETDPESLYDNLLQMDLEDMTIENTLLDYSKTASGYDLIIAADVLVYFGSLETILKVFSSVSSPGGYLIFSCERATLDEAPLGWRLLSSGRFAHTKQHVVDEASKVGYSLTFYEEIVPRMERGEEVKGHLFTFLLDSQREEL